MASNSRLNKTLSKDLIRADLGQEDGSVILDRRGRIVKNWGASRIVYIGRLYSYSCPSSFRYLR